ncbi:MAG: hypothetical protein ACK55Z_17220, partial [bacterium]
MLRHRQPAPEALTRPVTASDNEMIAQNLLPIFCAGTGQLRVTVSSRFSSTRPSRVHAATSCG